MTSLLEPPTVLEADEDSRAARRASARALLGVSGTAEKSPLRPVLREHGLTTYPMVAMGLLAVADIFQAEAFTILTPEISRALGLSLAAIAGARTLAFLAVILAPLPMAALAQSKGRRALLCIVTGIAWSLLTLFTGFASSLLALMAVLVLDGASTGSVAALHPPLLVDSYPPAARVRVLSGYSAFKTLGQVGAPLLVSLLAGPFDLTWRGVFIGLGVTSLAISFLSLGLKDPGPGRFDTEALRAEEHHRLGADDVPTDDVELKFFEIVRRVLLVPSAKRLASGYFALGILLVPFATYLSAFLEVRWDLDAGKRGLFFALLGLVSVGALLAFGSRFEARFSTEPGSVVRFAGVALMGAVGFIAAGALMPRFVLMVVAFAVAQSLLAILTPGLTAAVMSVLDARYRPHAAAVLGMFLAAGS